MTTTTDYLPPVRRRPAFDQIKAGIRAALPEKAETTVLLIILALVALWGTAIATFGYPALILPAVAAVPVIFTLLILITWG